MWVTSFNRLHISKKHTWSSIEFTCTSIIIQRWTFKICQFLKNPSSIRTLLQDHWTRSKWQAPSSYSHCQIYGGKRNEKGKEWKNWRWLKITNINQSCWHLGLVKINRKCDIYTLTRYSCRCMAFELRADLTIDSWL